MGLSIFGDEKVVVVVIPRKEAVFLGALLDACLDTVGNIEANDIDLTPKQIEVAENNMILLAGKLQAERQI